MVVNLLMVFITTVNETLKLRAKLNIVLIVDGLVTVVLKCSKSILQVYIYISIFFCV